LLQLPTYYTARDRFVNVNLHWLRQHVRSAMVFPNASTAANVQPPAEENCLLGPTETGPVSRFDDYRCRGKDLEDLCFFEYCMLIRRLPVADSLPSDLSFDVQHPRHEQQVQRIATRPSQVCNDCALSRSTISIPIRRRFCPP
jgi:hypothetical protein